jgi:hypothetical protein
MIPYISYELSAAVCKPTSQTGSQIRESNNPGLGTTYNVKRAESEPVTSRRFELRFCGILILLILAIVLVTLVVIHLPDRWHCFLIITTDGPKQ